ncbi:uncharacterized protein TrAFT101_011956 [Trichoderma asperellum]|uniref:uncharacterized protein n=1 Tax=Trichoderma asperellum TaxID=101201 RepID=UPI00331DA2AE|nr:hypothetical protein TrAFT101_011956 [Trichoderma asperellum]
MSNDGLPTYEAVMQKVKSYASEFVQTAQAKKLLLQAHYSRYSRCQRQDEPEPLDFSFLSKEENEKLTLEIAKLVSSDQGKAIMPAVAHGINKDIESIRNKFFPMLRHLKEVDDKAHSSLKFHDRFENVQTKFNTAIDNNFEDLILPLYNDDSISLDRKKKLIRDYIEQQNTQRNLGSRKRSLRISCPSVTSSLGDFKDFAKVEQTAIEVEIKKVEEELVALQDKLAAALEDAKKSLGIGLAVAGALVASIGATTAAGFGAYANSLQKDVDNKQSEIKVKKDKLADIKQVRQDLIEMGEYDFQLMQRSLDSIIMIWDSAKRDANDVM